ncbi:beta-secretase 2-like isoform X2 [Coregonus clupeaformis]|uniref:beta-secretase 2-like isoform X2 n=1 Tax=Coregonus clupeaformis TaxID=59861 RepID=UPI001E1C5217|nr:beta-secretase 2-like isoform X2 [Coregonus clupeaformis]
MAYHKGYIPPRALFIMLCFGMAKSLYTIPLKKFTGKLNSSLDLDLTPLKLIQASGNGLYLASDPAGIVNFLDMVNNLQGDSGRGYYMEMTLGNPGQKLNILVDTGSSNFAVAAAAHPFITHFFNTALSSTYQSTGRAVAVKYTQGNWEGKLGTDRVFIPSIPGTLTINIATILSSDGFFLPGVNWQGILGLAYPLLAQPDSSVEPFFNSMVRQTGIPDVFSLQMCGAGLSASTIADPTGGSLYNKDKAIVDSGTTLLRLPVNVFNAVVEAISRTSLIQDFTSGFWGGTKLACWLKGETPWRFFPKLSIYLRATNTSQSFKISILPQLYIQPITDVDGRLECFRFGISSSANGLVIGATVMEGFYVVFDRAEKRVGFAVSRCAVNGGIAVSEISGPFSSADVASDCAAGGLLKEPLLWVISYALIAVCVVVLLILLLLLVLPCRPRDRSGEITDESSLVRHRIK